MLGNIISFYSYKGGVGRSMAVANVGRLLGLRAVQSGQRVLLVDWDLDAPGLHKFFPLVEARGDKGHPGLIEFFEAFRNLLDSDEAFANSIDGDGARALGERLPLSNYLVGTGAPGVDLMMAGSLDSAFRRRSIGFDWAKLYENHPASIRAFRELIAANYRYCLVDSRTGYTDISGICTALIPEKLVAVFSPNEQNLTGLLEMVRTATEYRRNSDDLRPLPVFPLPSRIDPGEQVDRTSWLLRFENEFEKLITEVYGVADCRLSEYFSEVQLPYVSYFAYDERVAVTDEPASRTSLRQAYETFTDIMVRLDYPWQIAEEKLRAKRGSEVGQRPENGVDPTPK